MNRVGAIRSHGMDGVHMSGKCHWGSIHIRIHGDADGVAGNGLGQHVYLPAVLIGKIDKILATAIHRGLVDSRTLKLTAFLPYGQILRREGFSNIILQENLAPANSTLPDTMDGKTNPKRKKFFDAVKDFFD